MCRVFDSYKEHGTWVSPKEQFGGSWLSGEIDYQRKRETMKRFFHKPHRQRELLQKAYAHLKSAKRKEVRAAAGKSTLRGKFEVIDPSSPIPSADEADEAMDVDEW